MRVRHEYRYVFEDQNRIFEALGSTFEARNPTESNVPELADLMLDSYRGTVDYEGETIQEATTEVKSYFERLDSRPMLSCSLVLLSGDRIVSACLISKWEKRPDPLVSYITTRSGFKGRGLGRMVVRMALERIHGAGYGGAVAFVTEGNTPSERLLLGLGFKRIS